MPAWAALARLPWGTILTETATLLKRANDLRASRDETAAASAAAAAASGSVEGLRKRIEELEKQQRADTEIIQQLAAEIARVATAAEETSTRLRQAYLLAVAALVVSTVATLVAWLR